MVLSRHSLLVILLLVQPPLSWSDPTSLADSGAGLTYPEQVRRHYRNTSRFLIPRFGIVLEGAPEHISRMSAWLDEIFSVPHCRATLEAVRQSGNELTIRHSEWALQSSGRTLAPVTDDLINGRGADVVILFDARIPDEGSHRVLGPGNEYIEFTAVQNLFHELAHAKHLTNGTWRYANSEAQAIEEENLFRRQLSEQRGVMQVSLRAGIKGVQLWDPEASFAY